jgi:hypothetical protein
MQEAQMTNKKHGGGCREDPRVTATHGAPGVVLAERSEDRKQKVEGLNNRKSKEQTHPPLQVLF